MPKRAKIAFTHANAWVYDKTGGRIGGSFGGHRVLLLTTTGRRSHQPRRTPVQYELVDGETLIVAAGGGSSRPPQWYLNVQADPTVTVQTWRDRWRAEAATADADERARYWRKLIELNPPLAKTEQKAGRVIPVVRLTPVDGCA